MRLLPKNLYSRLTLITVVTVITGHAIMYAWTNLPTQTSGNPLTATIWNNLVTKINDIGGRTDGITSSAGGKVGIGTASPGAKLDVNGGNTLLNGVGIWSRNKNVVGTDTFSYDFNWGATVPLKIWASCSHWTNGYVALLETTITGDSYMGLSQWDQLNISSSTQGGWILSRPSNGALRITKTAGSYIGGMNCFITIMGPQVFTDANP